MCVLSENLPAAGNYNETLTCGRGDGFFDKLREPLGSFFCLAGLLPGVGASAEETQNPKLPNEFLFC